MRDLLEIGRYTAARWGAAQAERYLTQLDRRFHDLGRDPGLGRGCDEIRSGCRRLQEGKHVVFFRIGADGRVEILRVLHERMLPELHL